MGDTKQGFVCFSSSAYLGAEHLECDAGPLENFTCATPAPQKKAWQGLDEQEKSWNEAGLPQNVPKCPREIKVNISCSVSATEGIYGSGS